MRTLELPANATHRAWGEMHGESFAGEIRSLAELRVYLTAKGGAFPDEAAVRAVAQRHLPVLAKYDAGLNDELLGIAAGAGISPADAVVLNHYTDLRDLHPDTTTPAPGGDEGCSAVWTKTPAGTVLAQTWDMHISAMPYGVMVHVPAHEGAPGAWLLGLTGCLGMCGMNSAGLGLTINNLRSKDATVGVVWSALVRRALRERTPEAARDHILGAPIGSGHHYFVGNADTGYGIETTGVERKVVFDGGAGPFVHTNHCLDPALDALSTVMPGSSTHDRFDLLSRSLEREPARSVDDVWARLGSHDGYPRSVNSNLATPDNPHGSATCSAIAMDLTKREVLAQNGFIHNVSADRFHFGEDD